MVDDDDGDQSIGPGGGPDDQDGDDESGEERNGSRSRPSSDPSPRASKPKKVERVRLIRNLMASGRWVTGVTGRELARAWGVTYDTLKKDAAEASRDISEALANSGEIQAQLVATLQSICAEARGKSQLRTAIEALRVLVDLVKREGDEAPPPAAVVNFNISRLVAKPESEDETEGMEGGDADPDG